MLCVCVCVYQCLDWQGWIGRGFIEDPGTGNLTPTPFPLLPSHSLYSSYWWQDADCNQGLGTFKNRILPRESLVYYSVYGVCEGKRKRCTGFFMAAQRLQSQTADGERIFLSLKPLPHYYVPLFLSFLLPLSLNVPPSAPTCCQCTDINSILTCSHSN